MAEIAIAAAITITDSLINLSQNSNLRGPQNGLQSINSCLKTMKDYLKDAEGKEQTEGMRDRVQQVRDIAYRIEDVLEEFKVQMPSHFHEHSHKITKALHNLKHSVPDFIRKTRLSSAMRDIDDKMKGIINMDPFRIGCSSEGISSSFAGSIPPEAYPSVEDDELVGIEKRRDDICDLIISRGLQIRVISVVGPRGSGKTTLLKQVCEKMKHHFQCPALVPVPHSHTSICAALDSPFLSQGASKEELKDFLHQNKFILFFDGISSKEDWNGIKTLLPNHSSGSRVIVATHEREIASHICGDKPWHQIYDIKPLTAQESLMLFSLKLFGKADCPKYLIEYAESLLYKCEGLPLAIVAMASLLSNKQRNPTEFKKLYNSLRHELESSNDLSIFGRILLQSYYQLPPNRRCCFLYLCNFPENYRVRCGRLIRLWIGEQFIEDVKGKTVTEVGQDYLHELIQLNLVDSCGRDSGGKLRSCQVRSLFREFILSKAEKENFSSVLTNSCQDFRQTTRRLIFHDVVEHPSSCQQKDLSKIRTFMVFGRNGSLESSVNRLIGNFRLLRVLDLQDVHLEAFPEGVTSLILLRYLSLRNTKVRSLPRSIKNLQNLVTLDLRQTCIPKLHKKIIKLQNLLYLLVDFQDEHGVRKGVEVVPGIGRLKWLQKLSLVKASKNLIGKDLANLTHLRKLEISDLENVDGKSLCTSIENMEHLSSLSVTSTSEEEFLDLNHISEPRFLIRSLRLAGRLRSVPKWISSLNSVVKISLQLSRLSSSPLEDLKNLPSLLELQLVNAYIGEELEFGAGWFKELKVVEIERFEGLHTILIRRGAMPELRKFIIRRCALLRIAPLGIQELAKLEDGVLVYDMPPLQYLA